MYSEELEQRELFLTQLFLDPNNPRFWSERDRKKKCPDAKIPDDTIQKNTLKRIEAFGVKELRDSILRNGFLPMDRIVVRPIEDHGEKYVVVEGNRRLAAIKSLHSQIEAGDIDEDDIDEDYPSRLKNATQSIEVLLYKGTTNDISWRLQGIRHISGIREWSPAQQAVLVARLVEEGNTFTKVGQQFGLSGKAIGRLYRVYKALEQMRDDDEYGEKAQDNQFTLFDEAYKNSAVRNWLEWNEEHQRFDNTDNLKQFYRWILPDEEYEDKRRIHNPDHVRVLAQLLEKKRTDFVGAIERHEMTIEQAKGNLDATLGNDSYDWLAQLDNAKKAVRKVPAEVITEKPEELKHQLLELRECVDKMLKLLESSV